jgi:hypothetical protein
MYNPECRPLDFIDVVRKRYRRSWRIPKEPWPHIIMAQDSESINTGAIFIRVSKFSISFFSDVLAEDSPTYSNADAVINVMWMRSDLANWKIIEVPFNDQWKLQTYSPSHADWLVHTPNCRLQGDENCLRVQLAHYCLNPLGPKVPELSLRCKDLKRKLAYSHSFSWMRGGMFGWFLYLNPTWTIAKMFIEERNQTDLIHWDQKDGLFKEGRVHIHPPW